MEYKTYIQRLPTLKAYYDEGTKTYHVKCDGSESDVPKNVFEANWREQTDAEVEATKIKESVNQIATQASITALNSGDITALKDAYTTVVASVPNEVASTIPEVFPVWLASSVTYKTGEKVSYNGVL